MLSQSRRQLVVFTQGFPALQHFAQARFLPSNPFSSSCLWLDEDDFRSVQARARYHGVPNPLRIDPYAHHPTLSRYAGLDGLSNAMATAHGKRRGRPRKGELHVADAEHAAAVAHAPRSRGRPAGSTAAAVAQRAAASAAQCDDAVPYEVPICSMHVTKPLYLYNLDQMHYSDAGTPVSAFQTDGGDEEDERGLGLMPSGNAVLHGALDDGRDSAAASTPHSRATADALWSSELSVASGILELQRRFPNSSGRFPPLQQRQMMCSILSRRSFSANRQADLHRVAKKHGYQSIWWGTLVQWRKVGALPQTGQREHVFPIPVVTKLVHISLIADAATVLANSYISAKRRRLIYMFDFASGPTTSAGAVPDATPSASEGPSTAVPAAAQTTLFGAVHTWESLFDFVREDVRVNKWKLPLYLTARIANDMGLTLRPDAVGFQVSRQTTVTISGMKGSAELDAAEHEAAATSPAINRWVTRPPATEGDVAAALNDDESSSSSSSAAHRPGVQDASYFNSAEAAPHAADCPGDTSEFWYHISQVHFPDSYLIPSEVLSAEWESPGVPLAGATGRRLPFTDLTYERLLLDRPEVAAALLPTSAHHNTNAPPTARAETAETRSDASTASVTPDRADADAAAPETASRDDTGNSRGTCSGASADGDAAAEAEERAVARFVATHASPAHTQGRSLWYRADEVLAAGGIVDVNSAPVEVHVPATTVKLSGQAEGHLTSSFGDAMPSYLLNNAWFNVECLTNPDEALRLLSVAFAAR